MTELCRPDVGHMSAIHPLATFPVATCKPQAARPQPKTAVMAATHSLLPQRTWFVISSPRLQAFTTAEIRCPPPTQSPSPPI